MLSLAALRYRNILAAHGGPVERIETGEFSVCGRRMFQASAVLRDNLTKRRKRTIYGDCDGTGTHRSAAVARHMAVSEAMERWAFHATVRSERAAEFGFDVDPSSNGMAAFPGLLRTQARRKHFRRRQTSSRVATFAEAFSSISWAGRRRDWTLLCSSRGC